ncbi:MAG: alanine racemase [Candidatus Competibacter sp.]
MTEMHGGSVHFLFPDVFRENIRAFRQVLKEPAGLDHDISFAVKANKGMSFLEVASKEGIGCDVSSIYEYRAALGHGIPGERITLSGPSKNLDFLLLAFLLGSRISVDSWGELDDIHSMTKKADFKKVRILFRIGDLTNRASRFGFSQKELPELINFVRRNKKAFICEGFAFHLDGYSIEERAVAIQDIFKYIESARAAGIQCSVINIGGGYAVNYVTEEQGIIFDALSDTDFFAGNKPKGFYPYRSHINGPDFLKVLLNTIILYNHESIRDRMITNKYQLIIEPGRALLHQAGITCFSVKESRTTSSGDNIVNVDANINMLSEQWFNTDFLPGPAVVSAQKRKLSSYRASVGGNTCLEMDLLTKRKVDFPYPPVRGDVLVYLNTAGYQMDSNESMFHQIPLPQKVAVFRDGTGKWLYRQDTYFSRLDI